MPAITKLKQRRMKIKIFNDTPAWMRGEKGTYRIAKDAGTTYHTALRWLNTFKAELEKQKAIIPDKVIEVLEEKRNITTWKKLRNLIVKVALKQKASSTN